MDSSEIEFWLEGDPIFSLDYKYGDKIYKTDLQVWRPDPRDHMVKGIVYRGKATIRRECNPLDEVFDKLTNIRGDVTFSVIR